MTLSDHANMEEKTWRWPPTQQSLDQFWYLLRKGQFRWDNFRLYLDEKPMLLLPRQGSDHESKLSFSASKATTLIHSATALASGIILMNMNTQTVQNSYLQAFSEYGHLCSRFICPTSSWWHFFSPHQEILMRECLRMILRLETSETLLTPDDTSILNYLANTNGLVWWLTESLFCK